MQTDEEKAQSYLESLTLPQKNSPETSLSTKEFSSDSEMIRRNQGIIRKSDHILAERLKCEDSSLRVTDIINMKNDAFKQNRILEGHGDDAIDPRKLIPAVINIQVINNN